ncbi:hypothetical protein GCM10028798_13720 [Humibacter antri]
MNGVPPLPPYTIHRLGDRALIVDLSDLHEVLRLRDILSQSDRAGIDDIVPAARALAVLFDPKRISADSAHAWLERTLEWMPASAPTSGSPEGGPRAAGALAAPGGGGGSVRGRGSVRGLDSARGRSSALGGGGGSVPGQDSVPGQGSVLDGGFVPDGDPVVVDVVYDGDDLADTAALVGTTVDELVRRHTDATWRVAFSGFAPGFGYLVTDDPWFDVPRRSSPRSRVPAGAVGLAGGFSGAYPREGPGGWQLIGRTDAPLWHPGDSHPALLTPGTTVRFRAVDAEPASAGLASAQPASAQPASARPASVGPASARPASAQPASAEPGRTASTAPLAPRTVGRKTHDRPHEESLSDAADRAFSGGPFDDVAAAASTTDAAAASTTDAAAAAASASDAAAASSTNAAASAAAAPSAAVSTGPAVTVLQSGPQLLIEDLGRPGSASIGAGRSGALDRGALRLGNRLVGNAESAAGLEAVVGARLRFERSTWIAVTGARGALKMGGHAIEPDAAVQASPGDVLELGTAEHGLRYVVALRGGVAVPHELGSASTDIGAHLGPAPLADGDTLALADDVTAGIPAVDALTVWSPPDDEVHVHVVAGPRQNWFTRASVVAFYESAWRVTQQSNRVGSRLWSDAVKLQRSGDPALPAELPSEPMVPGAIQVPPSGEPTVLLADGPVTGGYPVIAVVADADLDLFAQLRPGQRIRFRHSR